MRAITIPTMAASTAMVTAQTVMNLTAITSLPTSANRLCLRTTTYREGTSDRIQYYIGVS